jgi:hypothetical protein
MNDRAAQLVNAFEGASQVADREIGERGRIARTRPALVDPKTKILLGGLPSRSGLGASRHELGAKHAAPEAASAVGVVSRELDQRD